MLRTIGILLVAAVGVTFLAGMAFSAESYPLISPARASVAAIAGREFVVNTASADPVTQRRAEWKAGVAAAYNLISPSVTSPHLPHISLNARAVIGLDTKHITPSVYLVWRVWSGKDL